MEGRRGGRRFWGAGSSWLTLLSSNYPRSNEAQKQMKTDFRRVRFSARASRNFPPVSHNGTRSFHNGKREKDLNGIFWQTDWFNPHTYRVKSCRRGIFRMFFKFLKCLLYNWIEILSWICWHLLVWKLWKVHRTMSWGIWKGKQSSNFGAVVERHLQMIWGGNWWMKSCEKVFDSSLLWFESRRELPEWI